MWHPNYGMGFLRRKKTKWWTTQPEGLACSTPPSIGPIFAARGRVISGSLANRFGSRFGTNTELLRGVVHPICTPNDYRNTVFDDVISLSESYRNSALPRSPRESFSLLQLTPCIEKVFPHKKGISHF